MRRIHVTVKDERERAEGDRERGRETERKEERQRESMRAGGQYTIIQLYVKVYLRCIT